MSNDTGNGTAERVYLSAADILALDDSYTEEVWVKEWGTFVRVRSLTGAQRAKWELSIAEMKNGRVKDIKLEIIKPTLISLCAIDEKGGRLFTDTQVKALNGKNSAALETLFNVAQRLSGLSEGDIEELEENLEQAPNADSGSN